MSAVHPNGGVVVLTGDALQRGAAQASSVPDSHEPVRHAVALRNRLAGAQLSAPAVRGYLDQQWAFHVAHAPDELAEMCGVAQGYGIVDRELFAYLHLGVIGDMADGCTAWARRDGARRAILAKNRDFRGEHRDLQRIFRHQDPAWGARRVLAVGSLGSPGVYSSGINTDGLALADTQVGTSDHGVGLLRYFLMTRILAQAASVEAALALVAATPHAGGGTLVLADASGALAAVELGHGASGIERSDAGFVVRTNHFVDERTAPRLHASPGDPLAANSRQRRARVQQAVRAWPEVLRIEEAFALMASHDGGGETGLCRHGQGGDASTISCAVFAFEPPTLYFSAGTPCAGKRVQAVP